MDKWWSALTTLEKFYWCITVPATTFMILQTIMTLLGLGGEVDADMDVDTDFDVDFEVDGDFDADHGGFAVDEGFRISWGIFSVRNLVAFFTFFGWTGALLADDKSVIVTIVLSVVAGGLAMMLSFGLFMLMQRMTNNGAIRHQHAVGRVARVYIPIPANEKGIGKVIVSVQGAETELEAMTKSVEIIPTGTLVRVIGVAESSILLVEKENEKE